MLNKKLLLDIQAKTIGRKLKVNNEEIIIGGPTDFKKALSLICDVQIRTIYRWFKDSITPSKLSMRALQKQFGINFYLPEYGEEKREEINNMEIRVNAMTRHALNDCYGKIVKYLQEGDVAEEKYINLVNSIEVNRLAIPEYIFDKILHFVEEEIGRLTYSYEEEFANTFDPELGTPQEDGSFEIKDEESLSKIIFLYMEKINQVENKFIAFSKRELAHLVQEV